VTPPDGATDVATEATVTATFNREVIAATVTASTFLVRSGGTVLSAAVSYDGGSRTARLSGPFLPGALYQVELTTGVTDDEGEPLATAELWSFTTRAWQGVTIDQPGSVGRHTSLAVDANGGLHVAYYYVTGQDLRYGACTADCGNPSNWTVVEIDDVGDVGTWASLVVGTGGRLHVTYWDATNFDLKYATCAASCLLATNWTTGTIDSVGNVGGAGSLTMDAGGRLHAAYFDVTGSVVKYSVCDLGCTQAAGWTGVGIAPEGVAASRAVIKVDATGRAHVTYPLTSDGTLRYVTCGAGCTTAGNWTALAVDDNLGIFGAMAVDSRNAIHLSYYDSVSDDLIYATCAGQCTSLGNWSTVAVDQVGDVGLYTSIVRGPDDRLHLLYYDNTNNDLKYATCAALCTAAASWRSTAVDQAGDVGQWTSAVLDGSGRLHAVYQDVTGADLRYIR
jgi:hypothetical protein